jgi:hypothetical protein
MFLTDNNKKKMSFGGDYGKVKDTGSVVSAVKNAAAAMVVAIPEITIRDEEDEFDARVGNEEYKKIHKRSRIHNSYYQCTQRITYILSSAYQKRIRVR